MAVTTSKVTYSLKPSTVERVEELAILWGVPKSEVIRRAIDQVELGEKNVFKLTPLQALHELQTYAGLTAEQAQAFKREVTEARRESGRKRG